MYFKQDKVITVDACLRSRHQLQQLAWWNVALHTRITLKYFMATDAAWRPFTYVDASLQTTPVYTSQVSLHLLSLPLLLYFSFQVVPYNIYATVIATVLSYHTSHFTYIQVCMYHTHLRCFTTLLVSIFEKIKGHTLFWEDTAWHLPNLIVSEHYLKSEYVRF